MGKSIFISGIDTDAGKSYATAWLGLQLRASGLKVMTQKFIQTGNAGESDDIKTHRRLMGDDIAGEPWSLTAPEIYSYPASPHLSARIDNRPVDISKIDNARRALEQQCDILLVEGAGGLMVPLSDDMLTIDYPHQTDMPVALVTNGRLGSINHTILSVEAFEHRGMRLEYLLYNRYYDSLDMTIAADAFEYISRYVKSRYPDVEIICVPVMQ